METSKTIFAFLAGLLLTCQAQAIPISGVGDTWTVDWLVTSTTSDLTATSFWEVTTFNATQITLDIDISNTTILTSLLTNADITTFGFGIDPDAIASILVPGTTFDMAGSGSGPNLTFPGGFKQIDVCIFAAGCAGGTVNDALHSGDSDYIQIVLTGDFSDGLADLRFFPAKFQTNQGSYEPGGCINGNGCTTVPELSITAVPEPTILSLFAVSLIGMIGMRRKKA